MSLFKEKDEYIKKAFQDIFDVNSDEEEEEDNNKATIGLNKNTTEIGCSGDECIENDASQDQKDKPIVVDCIEINCDDIDETEEEIKSNNLVGNSSINYQEPSQVITISDDEDDIKVTELGESFDIQTSSCSNNRSQDLDDHVFNLKLTIAGSLKQFRTTYKTKINESLQNLLQELNSQGKGLIVTVQDKIISLEETPHSLNLTPGTILKAIEISNGPPTPISRPNEIIVKVQDGNKRHTKEFKIIKNEPLVELKRLYAKEFKLNSIDGLRLYFDGDIVEDESTPEELDIEDDCILDLMFT